MFTVFSFKVAPLAGRLGDGGVGDVGSDRGGRLDAEEQHQQGGHQGAAAHPGHTDKEADAKAEEDDLGIRWEPSGARRLDEGRIPLFPFMTESVLKGAGKVAHRAFSP